MCGICGVVSTHPGSIPIAHVLERMRDTLTHRGPDGAGMHLGEGVGLGHRRLSIVDVEHGQQPMFSGDGRYVITYNGELFNHPALKPELEAAGVHYRTRSDTETALHLYMLHGQKAVERMRGMFAIAIWDVQDNRLFLARDRLGVKPVYYVHQADGTLLFASEIKALLAASAVAAELNMNAFPDYLANHAPSGEATLYKGVYRLPAGHTLTWHNGGIKIERYWDINFPQVSSSVPAGSAAERALVDEYRDRFTEAVRLRLMSDVPLGVFLSGGIDSAAITATMATLVSEPIRTFSVAFAEREANELEYARMVASRYATQHHEVIVSPDDFFSQLPKLIWHEDEPIAHPSSVALFFVSQLAAKHVKVVLTGEGSDETMAGYNRYRVTEYNMRLGALYERVVPKALRTFVRRQLRDGAARTRLGAVASRTFLGRESDLDDLYFDNFAVFGRTAQADLLTPAVRATVAGIDPYEAYHRALARVEGRPLVSRLLYTDIKTYLHELLMKQDQMSMAASIESRVPFLDHPLVEWVAQLPACMRLRGTTTKWILRAAMKDRLPEAILSRPKMGFPVPVGEWLRGPWRHLLSEFVASPRARDRQLFQPHAVDQVIAEHIAGVNHSERLWALLNFEIWARIFLDGEPPESIRLARAG